MLLLSTAVASFSPFYVFVILYLSTSHPFPPFTFSSDFFSCFIFERFLLLFTRTIYYCYFFIVFIHNFIFLSNTHLEKYERINGEIISILYKMGEEDCGNSSYLWSWIHFLLFCDHQDTEYEQWEIYISVAWSISTPKNIKCSIGQWYPSYTIRWKNIVVIVRIYGSK